MSNEILTIMSHSIVPVKINLAVNLYVTNIVMLYRIYDECRMFLSLLSYCYRGS